MHKPFQLGAPERLLRRAVYFFLALRVVDVPLICAM
jgi:hypothetical protein